VFALHIQDEIFHLKGKLVGGIYLVTPFITLYFVNDAY
jgi:hypothetical protein